MNYSPEPPIPNTLLLCPFCGGEADLFINVGHEHFVECKTCWAHGPKYLCDSNKATVAWSRRVQPTLDRLVEELEKARYSLPYQYTTGLLKAIQIVREHQGDTGTLQSNGSDFTIGECQGDQSKQNALHCKVGKVLSSEISDNKIASGLRSAIAGEGKTTRYVVHNDEVGQVMGDASARKDEVEDKPSTVRRAPATDQPVGITETVKRMCEAYDNTESHSRLRDEGEGMPGWHFENMMAAYEAALLMREAGWQPIKTAPRDGTPIMTRKNDALASWDKEFGCFRYENKMHCYADHWRRGPVSGATDGESHG